MEYSKYRIYVEKMCLLERAANGRKRFAYEATMEYGETELEHSFKIARFSMQGLVNAFLQEMSRRGISIADSEFRINEDNKEIDSDKETTKFIALLNKEVGKRCKSPSSERNNEGGKSKKQTK